MLPHRLYYHDLDYAIRCHYAVICRVYYAWSPAAMVAAVMRVIRYFAVRFALNDRHATSGWRQRVADCTYYRCGCSGETPYTPIIAAIISARCPIFRCLRRSFADQIPLFANTLSSLSRLSSLMMNMILLLISSFFRYAFALIRAMPIIDDMLCRHAECHRRQRHATLIRASEIAAPLALLLFDIISALCCAAAVMAILLSLLLCR